MKSQNECLSRYKKDMPMRRIVELENIWKIAD